MYNHPDKHIGYIYTHTHTHINAQRINAQRKYNLPVSLCIIHGSSLRRMCHQEVKPFLVHYPMGTNEFNAGHHRVARLFLNFKQDTECFLMTLRRLMLETNDSEEFNHRGTPSNRFTSLWQTRSRCTYRRHCIWSTVSCSICCNMNSLTASALPCWCSRKTSSGQCFLQLWFCVAISWCPDRLLSHWPTHVQSRWSCPRIVMVCHSGALSACTELWSFGVEISCTPCWCCCTWYHAPWHTSIHLAPGCQVVYFPAILINQFLLSLLLLLNIICHHEVIHIFAKITPFIPLQQTL